MLGANVFAWYCRKTAYFMARTHGMYLPAFPWHSFNDDLRGVYVSLDYTHLFERQSHLWVRFSTRYNNAHLIRSILRKPFFLRRWHNMRRELFYFFRQQKTKQNEIYMYQCSVLRCGSHTWVLLHSKLYIMYSLLFSIMLSSFSTGVFTYIRSSVIWSRINAWYHVICSWHSINLQWNHRPEVLLGDGCVIYKVTRRAVTAAPRI